MASDQPTATRREPGWWRTEAVLSDITSRYASGRSVRKIAADLGCSYGTVHQALVLAEVTMRPRGGSRKQTGTEPPRRTGNRLDHRVRAAVWAVTETAVEHIEQGRTEMAGQLLADELFRFDPETVRPEECLVEAAIAYAATSGAHGRGGFLPWTRYAYTNSRRVYPDGHAQIIAAAEAYAEALNEVGDRATAILIQRELIALLPADHSATDTYRIDLARALHETGDCREALREASTLLDVLVNRRPLLHIEEALLVRSVAAMQTGCHLHDLAAQTVALTTSDNVHGDLRSSSGYEHVLVAWSRYPLQHAAAWHPNQVCGHPACRIPTPATQPPAQSSARPAGAVVPARQETART